MLAYYLILFGTAFLILYAYRAVHIVTKKLPSGSKWALRVSFLLFTTFIYVSTSYLAVNRDTYEENQFLMDYTIIGAITLSVTLLSINVFQLIADIVLLGKTLSSGISSNHSPGKKMSRGTFLNKLALGFGGIMLGSFLWGTTKGIYGWRILTNRLSFKNLPKSFDGVKIVQISDLHLGSFNENFEPLKEAVQMVNELEPDYIFFTGDLVNENPTRSRTLDRCHQGLKSKTWKIFHSRQSRLWLGKSKRKSKNSINSLGVAEINKRMGFKILLNEHDILEKNGEKIGLVGVENWGFSEENWFPTKGDYKQSVKGMEEVPFKILLSHDPTHWDHHILGKEDVDLTLSGHTHGGQMGITIPGILEISAAKLFYKRYAGSYKQGNQHLYVNRGMGFLIFPGRVGMPPEITLHELNKA